MMKMILRKTSILLWIWVFLLSLAGNTQTSKDYEALDGKISEAVELFKIPGAAVGIVKNGSVVFASGYGLTDATATEVVDARTSFGIASCSKAFTAAAIAILVDEGMLAWDDKVIDYLPDFLLFDPYITRELTVRDLLCHRSGYQTFDGDLLWYGTSYSRKEVLQRFRHRENPYSMRARFGYSNIMFIAAGEVIEAVTGKTWDEFLEERIFIPLEFENTTTSNKGFSPGMNVALPHHEGKPMDFIRYDNAGPAASINSSVNDLLKWIQLMLGKGAFHDKKIFSAAQYYTLTSMQMPLNGGRGETKNATHFFGYGLGWFLSDDAGRKVIEHGGGLPGFHSKVVFVPEDSLGFVILASELSGFVDAVAELILNAFFRPGEDENTLQTYYQNHEAYLSRQEAAREEKASARAPGTKPSLELADYAGAWEDKMYGMAEISVSPEGLRIILAPAAELFTATLEHWHFDTFRFRFNDPFLPEGYLTFYLNSEGHPEHFTIDLENPDFHFYKLKFEKQE
ncbi:MAG: serine hydrolase [Bacteroidales bacterium]|nr:serine hydrolase [Bacteroidales bacterium]